MRYELFELINKIDGTFICIRDGQSEVFSDADELERSGFSKDCVPESIRARDNTIEITLKTWKTPTADTNAEWAKEHERQFGEAPGFF